jgi:hypothetical protein
MSGDQSNEITQMFQNQQRERDKDGEQVQQTILPKLFFLSGILQALCRPLIMPIMRRKELN